MKEVLLLAISTSIKFDHFEFTNENLKTQNKFQSLILQLTMKYQYSGQRKTVLTLVLILVGLGTLQPASTQDLPGAFWPHA